MDAGYGNNTNFLKGLESRRLKYLGAVAKNRKIWLNQSGENWQKIRLDEYAKKLTRRGLYASFSKFKQAQKPCGWRRVRQSCHVYKEKEPLLSS